MVGGEIFNTKHKVNKSKHVEPVKQKKRSMAPKRNEAISQPKWTELTKGQLYTESSIKRWVSNPRDLQKKLKKMETTLMTNLNLHPKQCTLLDERKWRFSGQSHHRSQESRKILRRFSTGSKSSQQDSREQQPVIKAIPRKDEGIASQFPYLLNRTHQKGSKLEGRCLNVTQEEEDNWMIPIQEFLQLGKLPDDPQKARKLRINAPLYKAKWLERQYQDHTCHLRVEEQGSKKVQRTLLKQQYENFAGLSSETMDQTFDRNKQEIETISLDDLYNNLKIYEPEISGSSSTSQNPQNVAFVSSNSTNSNSSTNEADNTAYGVSAAHTQSNPTSRDNLSDVVIYAFLASLESVEARLAHYKKNEAVFEESINVLNLEVKLRDNALVENKKKLEKEEKERDELKLTLEKFQNSFKSLNNLLESQVVDKFKTGLGYNAASSTAASPAVESFVNSSEIENIDVITVVTSSNVHKVKSNHESADVKNNGDVVEPKTVRKNSFRPPVIEDWNSDDDSEVEFIPNVKDKIVRPSTKKIKFVKSARKTVEKVETPKQNKHYPRGNQRNWNNLMSQRLGSDFEMINKACFICGSFEHLQNVCDKKVIRPVWNNSSRVNHKNFANKMTHPHPNRRFVPQEVLTKFGKINIAGARVNTAVRQVNTASSKTIVNHPRPISNAYKKGYSQVTKPFNKSLANKNNIFNKKVNTVKVKDTTARDRVVGNPHQKEYKEKGVIDNGCSRHITGNKCYLIEYKDYDGGFVSFGDGKGRISGKGKIKTGTLDFDNVYFCKELKYNLFSMSQICDKKNNVLFTDTECLVLSSDFNLLDESQVLLRVPRKDNIYSVDLKSIVPTKGLTCLFAKVIIDESNLWHRRLGHINFKNMNKLVRGNLVRGDFLRYSFWPLEMDIQEKDKNKAKKDKTEHENEKSVKKQSKSKSQQRSQPRQSQSQLSKSKSTPRS
ncbi:ribonuclease H-like domain-containing protein [Tanacetum coccineum]